MNTLLSRPRQIRQPREARTPQSSPAPRSRQRSNLMLERSTNERDPGEVVLDNFPGAGDRHQITALLRGAAALRAASGFRRPGRRLSGRAAGTALTGTAIALRTVAGSADAHHARAGSSAATAVRGRLRTGRGRHRDPRSGDGNQRQRSSKQISTRHQSSPNEDV